MEYYRIVTDGIAAGLTLIAIAGAAVGGASAEVFLSLGITAFLVFVIGRKAFKDEQ